MVRGSIIRINLDPEYLKLRLKWHFCLVKVTHLVQNIEPSVSYLDTSLAPEYIAYELADDIAVINTLGGEK